MVVAARHFDVLSGKISYYERIEIDQTLKTQIDFVLFACSLDHKMKERAEAVHPTNTPWFMRSKEASKPSAKRVATAAQK